MTDKEYFEKPKYCNSAGRVCLATVILSFLLTGCGNIEEENTDGFPEQALEERKVIDFDWDDFDNWGWRPHQLQKLADPVTGGMILVPVMPDSLARREVNMYGFFKEYIQEKGAFIFQDTAFKGGTRNPTHSQIEVVMEDASVNVDEFLNTEQYIIGELYLKDYDLEHPEKGIEVIPKSSPAMRNARIMK